GLTHAGAANGEQALAELAADPSIEIVITDCRMPEMTGPELHGRIRAAGIPVSVVLMSAFPRDVVMDGRDDDDADLLFLEKPFTFLELHQVLAERLRTG
ncbi:MAG: response regulator, partial [Pseudomonadota bacterium]